jgi:hypothetical protein
VLYHCLTADRLLDTDRYPKLPLALFSTSQDACATAKAVGVATVRHVSSSESESERTSQEVLTLLTDDEKKLVVVHVEHPVSPGHWLDALVAQLLPQREADGSGKFFVAVVQKCAGSKESPMHPFRPRQSFAKHDGAYAPGSDESATHRLLLAFVHHDHTRCDAVERFNAADVEAVGGGAYGTMSAHVWIKETAFRLGFAPKYGA